MAKGSSKVLGSLQKLGKGLMAPIACLPAAALLLRLGAPDILNIEWMHIVGQTIFDHLPILYGFHAIIYFIVFYFGIIKFNIQTLGREDDGLLEDDGQSVMSKSDFNRKKITKELSISKKARAILEALRGKENIESIDACVTRIRLVVVDANKLNEIELKRLGASGIMKLDSKNVQVIFGTLADPLVINIKKIM